MSCHHKVALVVGHSRRIDSRIEGGAVSVGGVSEHKYNSLLADMIQDRLSKKQITSFVVSKAEGSGYTAAMKWISQEIDSRGATVAIELHFNSASQSARGSEWLAWHTSKNGQMLASLLAKHSARWAIPSRGVKLRNKTHRGAGFLSETKCPAVIGEPFFGSNILDWRFGVDSMDLIADTYTSAIEEYVRV